jgi:two-component system, response regulator PdtaR
MDTAEFLRQSGYHVSEAANATEAIDVLASKLTVDLVVTDVKMPGEMDGFALAEWIKTRRPCVEVVFTSGDSRSKELAERSLKFGAFLPKPYTGGALRDLIGRTLARRAPKTSKAADAA